jgi:cobalamin synthase
VVLGSGAPLAVAKLARAQIGGYTGDVLGGCEVVVECVVLTAAACAFSL